MPSTEMMALRYPHHQNGLMKSADHLLHEPKPIPMMQKLNRVKRVTMISQSSVKKSAQNVHSPSPSSRTLLPRPSVRIHSSAVQSPLSFSSLPSTYVGILS